MKLPTVLLLLYATSVYAQCEAPVPCKDPTLLALQASDCQKHHIFVARGSDSGYPGHLGPLIVSVCEGLDDCGYENIVYPAKSTAWGKNSWCNSATVGATHGQAQMTSYAEKCPDSKLILMGYSQGASVALDVLGGGGGAIFDCVQGDNPAMDKNSAPGKNIVAAIVFGAVRRTAGEPYTATSPEELKKGGMNFNGTAPRSEAQLAGLSQYSNILRDYCNFGDPICAVGSQPVDVAQHLNYFKLYTKEAAEWVIGTVQGKNATTVVSTSASASASTSKATATTTSMEISAGKTSADVEAAASTSTPVSMAGKRFETFTGALAVAMCFAGLFFSA